VARLKPEFAARADSMQVPIFTINYGLLGNTAVIKPQDMPRSWQDLLDPKWKGRILLDDPRVSGGGRVMFHMTMDRFGRGFHERLASLQPVFSRDYGEAVRRVARGEFALYVPLILSEFGPLKGLPIAYVIPEEGVTYGSYSVSVLRNAPHPNAARLLCDFYLSDEAQAIYANSGHGIVIRDLATPISSEMAPLANVKPLVAEDFTRIEEYLVLAKQIYG
jgi:iron(III) transport system substrate-binding protein